MAYPPPRPFLFDQESQREPVSGDHIFLETNGEQWIYNRDHAVTDIAIQILSTQSDFCEPTAKVFQQDRQSIVDRS